VLAYHRIADPNLSGFDTFEPNVSATPAAFAAQMDFIRQRFNVISGSDLVAWLQGEQSLPQHPVLITFDDGYRDNLDQAWPILQERNMSAVIFLATDYIGHATPFYWDLIAYCFHHTAKKEVDLPLIGFQRWSNKESRTAVVNNWLGRLKKLPDREKWAAVRELPRLLDVSISEETFAGLHLNWEQVRTMAAAGIEMGAHTQSHPILTRIAPEEARLEVEGSKKRVEAEINQPVTLFAYPNGLPTDFNGTLQAILTQVGFKAAFTLVPGPTRPKEVQQEPMAIRRIFLHHQDTLPRFAAKVMGVPRLLGQSS
jgi:peptidoglycan/xylan/chitin deacetylase (PgdA/CDA1 family)